MSLIMGISAGKTPFLLTPTRHLNVDRALGNDTIYYKYSDTVKFHLCKKLYTPELPKFELQFK